MNVKKGDYVVFKQRDKTYEGLVLGSNMGLIEIMTKDAQYNVRSDEIIEIKGNVFERWT